MLFYILLSTLGKMITLFRLILIIQFLMGMALVFNLISTRNGFVRGVWQAINALLDPVLNPIRRALPMAGGLDFSPIVLLMVLSLLYELIGSVAMLGF